jgi:hypothetical protein
VTTPTALLKPFLPGGVQAFGWTDRSGVGIPCLEFMPAAQRDDTLGQARIEVREEEEVLAIPCLIDCAPAGSGRRIGRDKGFHFSAQLNGAGRGRKAIARLG